MSSEAVGWVFRHSPMEKSVFQVHVAIADSVNDQNENEFWMRQSNLAKKARVSRETVNRAIKALIAAGLLELLEENPGSASRFRLLTPPGLPPMYGKDSGGVTSDHTPNEEGVCAPVSGGVTNEHTGCDEPSQGVCAPVTPTTQENPSRSQQEPKTPQPPAEAAGDDEVQVVFDEWRRVTGHPRAVLDAKRRRVIEKALAPVKRNGGGLGLSIDEVLAAIRGWEHSSFHRGDNERGTVYDDIGLILRDRAQAEKFIGYGLGERRDRPASKSAARADRGRQSAVTWLEERRRNQALDVGSTSKEISSGL